MQIEFPQSNICTSLWGENKLDELLLALMEAYGYYEIFVEEAKEVLSSLNEKLMEREEHGN